MFKPGEVLITNRGEFEVIKNLYINSNKSADYNQVRNKQDIYLLKSVKELFVKYKQELPFVKMHLLGADLSSCFNLQAQKNEIIWHKNLPYLLTRDIRNRTGFISMESLDFYSDRIPGSTVIGLTILYQEYIKATSTKESDFFLRQLIFDIMTGHSQRDAFSMRIFEVMKTKKLRTSLDFLIDHDFGSGYLRSESEFYPSYSKLDLYNFFEDNDLINDFLHLSKNIKLEDLINIIQTRTYLNKNQKEICYQILLKQGEFLKSLMKICESHSL